jgi:hypothetical protein
VSWLEPQERHELPRAAKAWRGIPAAELQVARSDDGWRAALSFAFFTGSHWGSFSGIWPSDPAYETRESAIDHASRRLRHANIEPAMEPERRRIVDWLGNLTPAQDDLFSRAAA